jgi:Protein of unknown function (DUF3179)
MDCRTVWLPLVFAAACFGQFNSGDWRTDKSKHSIKLSELQNGGPPKDGIMALVNPSFTSPGGASQWLNAKEPVIVVERPGEPPRAYPLQTLLFHELVNDQIGDMPILISYCPLCNSGIVFERRLNDQILEFGVSGMLRQSDMIMYDRQTDSLWQQITGEAIVGTMTGKRLRTIPSQIVAFGLFAGQFPHGRVMSRNTGYRLPYGRNPYVGYESSGQTLFPVQRLRIKGVKPLDRLVVVDLNGVEKAYSFALFKKQTVMEDGSIVILFDAEARSAVDGEKVAKSRAVGAVGVFSRRLGDVILSFRENEDHRFEDLQTHSLWNLFGIATSGPMAGKRLTRIEHNVYFAFAWLAFKPDTRVVTTQ